MSTTDYASISAGSEALPTMTGHLAAGQGQLSALTPLMLGSAESAGKLIKWDGTPGKAVTLTVAAIDATTAKTTAVYKSGCINAALVAWPESVITMEAKRAGFLGSPISVEELK
ncbi:head decoration protein [Shigella sonnei]|nr:head decoration protein [Shigella sonnei]EFV9547710.1 head decoration protein [Shigella sonnei]